MTDSVWFVEDGAENVIIRYRCLRTVYSGQSRFARIDIVDTAEYGRMLFLDGIAQSSEQDEFIYHENLVHPPMLLHQGPKSVCVIGGAEGATLREVSKYEQVNRIVMVDIDEELVKICQEHLSGWSNGAYDDPRLELYFEDGRKYLEKTKETFDVILVDLGDPTENSPAVFLFTHEFYQLVFHRMTRQGIACFQGEDLQPTKLMLHAKMVNTLSSVFPWVVSYPYMMPSFHETHSFILSSKDIGAQQVDIGERLRQQSFELQYLTPSLLQGLFCVPGYVEEAYNRFQEPITDDHPHLYKV
jgi:spermidine synthase